MKTYKVEINGVTHFLQLDAEDAKRYGDAAVEVKAEAQPANKSRTADNK
ncbi:hypothetical protein PP358_gp06 [Arthrobacter phage Shoya]|uniref:Uncharacterized protein n=1 Tax=Arthrobacter phage Shoya TaxID=2704035 RepID=A0A6G6XHZ3_9CAUD|nr:hypothetical protein PP358_gp06 [Arthrobacter phage Shoya]QIG57677.1 hypothetical protein SEA_SHOYA_6 [Arthrobacter phage Shoya]